MKKLVNSNHLNHLTSTPKYFVYSLFCRNTKNLFALSFLLMLGSFTNEVLADNITFSSTLDTVAPVAVEGIIGTSTGLQLYRKARHNDPGICGNIMTFDSTNVGYVRYDSYSFRPNLTSCITISLTSVNLMPVLYTTSFDPNHIKKNFVSYGGGSGNRSFSFTVNAGQEYVLVINEALTGDGIGTSYTVTISGITLGPTVKGDTTVCSGVNSKVLQLLNVSDPVVRWEFSINGGNSWSNIENTSYNYTALNLIKTTMFRAVIRPASGNDTASLPATITVNPSPDNELASFDDVCNSAIPFAIKGGLPHGGKYSGIGISGNSDSINYNFCIYSHSGNCTFTNDLCSEGDGDSIVTNGFFSSAPVILNDAKLINSIVFKLYYTSCTGTGQLFTFYLNGDSIGSYLNTDGSCSCNPIDYPLNITLSDPSINNHWNFAGSNVLSVRNSNEIYLAGYGMTINYSNFLYSPTIAGVGAHSITYSYTNSFGCSGVPANQFIKIGPPSISAISDISVCSGQAISIPTFASNLPGSTFSWTNDNVALGLASNGTNNIAAFNAPENISDTDLVATITVTPHLSCDGVPVNFKITVKPKPIALATPVYQEIYTGTSIEDIVLTTQNNLSGSSFAWTRDHNSDITGIAITGTGNINGNLTNLTNDTVTVTFTIDPANSDGCSGPSIMARVKVYPSVLGGAVTGGSMVCHGSPAGLLKLTGFTGDIIKWQSSVSPYVSWVDIANTDSFYSPGNIFRTTKFRAIVQSGSYDSAQSYPATVVDDTIKPIITCEITQVKNHDTGVYTYTVQGTEFDATATDNCGIISLVHNYNGGGNSLAGEVFPVDTTTVTWTATDNHGNTSSKNFMVIVQHALSVSTTGLNIGSATNNAVTFDITSNTSWSVTASQTWVSMGIISGSGNATIIFSVQANPLVTERTATITVSGTGVTDKIITITQAGAMPLLSISPATLNVGSAANSTGNFDITSNTNWTLTSSDNWLIPNLTGGQDNATINLNVSANQLTGPRTAYITVSATGASDKVISVIQAGAAPILSVSSSSLSIGSVQNSTISFDITSNTTWADSSSVDWLSTDKASGAGDATITLTGQENPVTIARTATVKVSAEGITDQLITITQIGAAPVLSVSADTLNINAPDHSSSTFNIASNTNWTLTVADNWLTADLTSGSGNSGINLVAQANPTIKTRTTNVIISAAGVSDQVITLTQAGAAPLLSVSVSSLDMDSVSGSTATFSISSNTSWSVLSSDTWLTSNLLSGSGNDTIILSAEGNSNNVQRIGKIILIADGIPNQTVTVTQAGIPLTLSLSATALDISALEGSTVPFKIFSNTNWSVTSSASWLTSGLYFGAGNDSIVLIALKNPTINSRTAIVTVLGYGVTGQIITVTQSGAIPFLEVSATSFNLTSPDAYSITFKVFSNINWSVTCPDSWLSLSPASGSDSAIITLDGTANTAGNPRTTSVTLSGAGVSNQVLTLTQAAASIYLNVSPLIINLGAEASSNIIINIVSTNNWSVSSSDTWLSTGASSGTGNSTVNTIVTANPTVNSRSAVLTFSMPGVPDQNITVIQAGKSDAVDVNSISKISVYPVPVTNILYISGLSRQTVVSVYNVIGNIIIKNQLLENQLDVSALRPGVYLLKGENKGEIFTKRFVKQ